MLPTPDPLDCAKPLPGPVAKLVDNDEIMVGIGDLTYGLSVDKVDDKEDGSKELISLWDWTYKDYRGASITTADLDGDTRDEVVMGFNTGGMRAGELGALSLKNPEVNDKSQLQSNVWTSFADGRYGYFGGIKLASGNLDGGLAGGDKADEVGLAFQDALNRLQLVLFDGEADGGITYMTWWSSTDNARTYILTPIAVDVGDVDSDGYDNDIVLAFVDGSQDVQVVVLKLNQNGGLTEMGWESWTDDDRGDIDWKSDRNSLDVAVGDFNGDATDEIAVAFRDHSHALQVMQVVYDPSGDTVNARVNSTGWWRDTGHGRGDVASVSVAAGDIDNDGNAEIISAFADSSNHLGVVTLDADTDSPTLRGSYGSGSGALSYVSFFDVQAGDIDGQGKVEVVIVFDDDDFKLEVVSFDDNPDCPCDDDASSGLVRRSGWTLANQYVAPYGIALGDVNGDSVYGDYTEVCTSTQQVRVTAMAGLPPVWETLNDTGSEVGYGKSNASDKQTEHEVTTTYGSSSTFDGSFHFHEIELGPVITKDWEHSITASSATGDKVEIRSGWIMDDDGFVPVSGVTYYSYQYARRDNGALARVDVPVGYDVYTENMTNWNASDGERTQAPTTWTPAYRSGWMDAVTIEASLGTSIQGTGSDFYAINGNDTQDYLFAWIDESVHYRIGWDMAADGKPASWSTTYDVPGFSGKGAGLGAAVTELNGNTTPDLVIAWVIDPAGENQAHYVVGWDLNTSGQATRWSETKTIPHWIGSSTQGAGLDILDINGDARPELFFGWIDNPADVNKGYYRVGWDLDANGDSANWWVYPKEIIGAFGPENAGLGLTLIVPDDDAASAAKPDLMAAWVRDVKDENQWAYSIGEQMDGDAYLHSWVPGQPVAVPMQDTTSFAGLTATNLVTETAAAEFVVSWIDAPKGTNSANLSVGYYRPLVGDPDLYPTAVVTTTNPNEFRTYVNDHWWNVRGAVNWRWDVDNQPIIVNVGGANPTWSVDKSHFSEQTTGTSSSYNIDIAGEAKFMGIGVEGSISHGFEKGSSQSISWETGWYMDGMTKGLPNGTSHQFEYKYAPYTYMQTALSVAGVEQAYMVLDYIVPYIGRITEPEPTMGVAATQRPALVPAAPLIASPSHPDPGIWYPSNTVDFTWAQPGGDAATVDGYSWYLDRVPDTQPNEYSQGLYNATAYTSFPDGLWTMHVRARDQSGAWGPAGHRAVRLDGQPPQVAIELDPPLPVDSGWYNTPVVATVVAADPSTSDGQTGSGVVSVEVSTDGVTWQAYTAPLIFDQEQPPTTLWARATDAVGHVSQPMSTTFGLDLTMPNSKATPGCWDPGGSCVAEVITDTVGNERIHVAGNIDGALSGATDIALSFDGASWTPVTDIDAQTWSFVTRWEVGAGCHVVDLRAEDRAGNVEAPHRFTDTLVWLPREQPVLAGTGFALEPDRARPGEPVTVSLIVRNGGFQETWAPLVVDVPTGVTVLDASLTDGGVYDPGTRQVTWPAAYVWPGAERKLAFRVQVDAELSAMNLPFQMTLLGTWPIAGECSDAARAVIEATQLSLTRTATLVVEPALDPGVDVDAPAAPTVSIQRRRDTFTRELQLHVDTGETTDATRLFVREWGWDPAQARWAVRGESGWTPFSPTVNWTLSADAGVKYVGVWLADAAGNVSTLRAESLVFANVLEGAPSLADGERVQYRFPLDTHELAIFNLIAVAGNPNLYVWQPFSGFHPQYAATTPAYVDTVGFRAETAGLYLVEIEADVDSQFELVLSGDIQPADAAAAGAVSPAHPLTVSDPLSAGVAVAPLPPGELYEIYLPNVQTQEQTEE
ncbi:MAG: hypothetical protein R2851_12980 [Caldilineaceae bacterium]